VAGTGGSTAMAKEKEEEGLVGWEQGGEREAVLAEQGEMRERSVEERLRFRPMVDGDMVVALVERGILGWIEWVVRGMVVGRLECHARRDAPRSINGRDLQPLIMMAPLTKRKHYSTSENIR
jgi:hypothetical protein